MNHYKKLIKKYKLTALYISRIIFAKNYLKSNLWQKIKANLNHGFLADQWILYDLDHNDKKQYLTEFEWYKSRYINEPFNAVLNNKIIATEVLKQYTRVATNYVIKNNEYLTNFESEKVNYNYIITLLKKEKQLFMKAIGAGKGKGVYLLTFKNKELFIDTEVKTEDELIYFLKKENNYFISEVLIQNNYANKLYDKTTNTIRIITLRDIETHNFKIFFAVQRIGTSKTIPVDNGSRGGLVSNINLETGELSIAKSLHSLETHRIHPDSKNPIEGVKVPGWNKIKNEVLELSNKMPYMNFIAWDVLLTEDGISIVEGNTSSGVNIIQLWGGQRNGELGNFYRHHKIIK